jgi:Flp pilus assembly protein TadG
MRRRPENRRRRGATLVEAALVLPLFLLIVLGMIDLGVAISRNNALSQAARQGARVASIHGAFCKDGPKANWNGGPWGPATVIVSASDTGPVASAIRPYLSSQDVDTATITVEWPDGNNEPERGRVKVEVTTSFQPITTYVFSKKFTLTASSTMLISH